jgi:hypothetical protein
MPPPGAAGLGEVERARYAADGYLAPLEALSAAEAQACREQLAPHLDARGLAEARIRNDPHLLFTWAAELVRHPRIVAAVSALLGPDVLARSSALFIKGVGDPGYNAWHQDGAYWDLVGDRVVTAWIALTDSTAANGAVRVLPGSHRGPRLRHELRGDAHGRLLRGQAIADVDERRAVALELRAGQFSLHDVWLVHGSPPNPGPRPRIGLAVRYLAADVQARGPRRGATLVCGSDRFGRHDLEPRPRHDFDPVTASRQRRALRRYALHVAWQIAREPSAANLRLLGRLAMRGELARALWRGPRGPRR